MNEDLKRAAAAAIDAHQAQLVGLSHHIHNDPELCFQEVRSARALVDICRSLGWQAELGLAGLATAWQAQAPADASAGATVAFLAEYDALPEIGHACGHNIMAATPIGAMIGVQAVRDRLHGQARIIGTPAEEGGGGKVLLANGGAFQGIDAAMMIHPTSYSVVRCRAQACEHFDVEFRGRPAHAAASPEKGLNALNALILSFNNLDALRQHIRGSARIHGVIRHGGDAANIVPDYTLGEFMVRDTDNAELDQLMSQVKNCFQAGALATGTSATFKDLSARYETILSNETAAGLYRDAMQRLDVDCPMDDERLLGSTDMGNISWQLPAIHPTIKIADGVPNHTREFAAAAVSPAGDRALMDGAKALAFTAIDLLAAPELVQQMQREHVAAVRAAREG